MKIKAHCFIKGIRLDVNEVSFELNNLKIKLKNNIQGEISGMTLEYEDIVEPKELKIDSGQMDKEGNFIRERLKKYRSKMLEISIVIEGLFATHYLETLPAFDLKHLMVNVIAENIEEQRMLDNKEITRGFGDIFVDEKKYEVKLSDEMIKKIQKAYNNIPALSFYSEARRAQSRGDAELAFFLYFRIIEGYYGDGTPRIEKALHNNQKKLETIMPYNALICQSYKKILTDFLKLKSKAENGFNGLISDLVLLRHKLTHFDTESSDKHFNSSLRFEMDIINKHLDITCLKILREQID